MITVARFNTFSRWTAVIVLPLVGLHIAVRLWSPDFEGIVESSLVFVLTVAFALEEVVVIVAPDTPISRVR